MDVARDAHPLGVTRAGTRVAHSSRHGERRVAGGVPRDVRDPAPGTPTEPLQQRFPSATVITNLTETVLYRRVEESSELDWLLEQLLSMGLVLTEVHQVPEPEGAASEGGEAR